MQSEFSVAGCLRSFVVVAGVMLLCFVLGLLGQVGWLGISRATAPDVEPTAILVPTLLPTRPGEAQAQAPTATVEPTFTPLGLSATRTPTRGAEPTRTTSPTQAAVTRTVTATPTTTDENMVRYVVESGDTLSAISVRFDVPAEEIIAANPELDPDVLEVGDVILIPQVTPTPRAAATRTPQTGQRTPTPQAQRSATPRRSGDEDTIEYTIQEGDTLFSISTEFNVTVQAILDANPELDQDLILSGTVILIPQPEE